MTKKRVLIFDSDLLPRSETFVYAQSSALQVFTPCYAGIRRVDGLDLPNDRAIVVNQGGVLGRGEEGAYLLAGVAPCFYRRIGRLNPVLIHAHFGESGTTALALKRRLRLPLVVTYHGYDATTKDDVIRRSAWGRRYLHRREALKREARLFLAVSQFIRGKLTEQGFPAERVVVHYIGIDTDLFRPDHAVQREPIVLFVGRLVEKKGCEHLIRAMASVQAKRPLASLVIIGDGPLRPALERLACRTLRNYSFLGFQPPEQVRSWLNRSSAIGVPSVTALSGEADGLPMVVLEAQSMELPAVCFTSSGIPEAVQHEKTGLLVPPGNSEALGAGILRLLEDRSLWQTCSMQARKLVVGRFDLKRQTHSLEALYSDVISGQFVTR